MTSTMQLEFAQAMSDFKIMFPDMDRDVIEAVLRSNQGGVDATIDQLLAMSIDNQNEKLRNELDKPSGAAGLDLISSTLNISSNAININPNHHRSQQQTISNVSPVKLTPPTSDAFVGDNDNTIVGVTSKVSSITNTVNDWHITGASPKLKKVFITKTKSQNSSPINTSNTSGSGVSIVTDNNNASTLPDSVTSKKWNPPILGQLPVNFLRIQSQNERTEYDIPDEQFALMLQNEEFMNELRWNQEFMLSLEKEQHEKGGRHEDDMIFKERLKYMGKRSRKKFLQLARVFTWQRNKKPPAVRHPDSLLLQEEHSDDDEHHQHRQHSQHQSRKSKK